MPLIALEEAPRALENAEELSEQTCARRVKKIVSFVDKMHTSTTSMQVKLAAQARSRKEQELTLLLEAQPQEA